MRLDYNGYRLITSVEGFKSKPYLDSAKIPTIGYGSTYYVNGKKVTLLDPAISKEQGYEMFKTIADNFAKRVKESVKSSINQNQFNALVCFAYNTGMGAFKSSTLLKKVNANPTDTTIKSEFLKWVKSGGVKVEGLVNRRNKEIEMYYK
jgi:lysozyme